MADPDALSPAGIIRKARVTDAGALQQLIRVFADRDEMLHRSLGELYENIRDFFVAEEAGKVVACGAIHVCWSHLAEIKSLAVAEDRQSRGYGRRIVTACVEEAAALELRTVFALTYKPEFFARLGFRVVDKATLPHKVWNECIRCPKFTNCGEIAVVRDLAVPAAPAPWPIELPMLSGR